MKKYLLIFSILLVGSAYAVSSNFQASATLKNLFSVSEQRGLNFGLILVSPTSNGTITLKTDNSITATGHNLGGGHSTGIYNISGGTPNSVVTVNISGVTLYGPGSAGGLSASLTVGGTAATAVTLDGTGKGTITAGGALDVNAGTLSGLYHGAFIINIDYQ